VLVPSPSTAQISLLSSLGVVPLGYHTEMPMPQGRWSSQQGCLTVHPYAGLHAECALKGGGRRQRRGGRRPGPAAAAGGCQGDAGGVQVRRAHIGDARAQVRRASLGAGGALVRQVLMMRASPGDAVPWSKWTRWCHKCHSEVRAGGANVLVSQMPL